MSNVRLNNVRKVYDNGFEAVRSATFDIEDGEFVVLVGPSGCGKSTTLRMVAGLESVTDGDIYIGDRRVNDVPPKDRDIAMVFQNYALYPHMSVFDNMAFGLKLRKFPKKEIEQRVKSAAETLGISEILDRKPKQLSGGQRQRVAVGRAIVRRPQVFLFDEPLSNLDAKLRVQMRTEISKLHRTLGATMVYVTHDQVEAMTMGDRIVVLKDGDIQQIDSPLNLYNRPTNQFVAGFIGSPAMNFLEGSIDMSSGAIFVSRDGSIQFHLADAIVKALKKRESRPVVMGIRPEDIYLSGGPFATPTTEPVTSMMLEVMEPMGNEIFLYTRSAAGAMVARIAPQPLPEVGSSVSLAFDTAMVHLFDADSGDSLVSYAD